MPTRRLAATALLLAATPLVSGCYTTIQRTDSVKEEITSRDLQPYGTQVEVTATRRDGAVVAASQQRKTCRGAVHGTKTPVAELRQTKNENAAIVGGLSVAPMFLVSAWGIYDATRPGASPEARSQGKVVTVLGLTGLTASLVAVIAHVASPAHRVRTELGEPGPLNRWDGEPFPCAGAAPEPLPAAPVLASFRFPSAPEPVAVKAVTDSAGKLELDVAGRSLPGAFCGAPQLELAIDPAAASFAKDARRGPPARLALDAPAKALTVGEIARADPEAGRVAAACCFATRGPAVQDECEERCARAGQVEKCLFARRACAMKAERTAEGSAAQGIELCGSLYAECLVGNGTTLANLSACADACRTQKVAELCR